MYVHTCVPASVPLQTMVAEPRMDEESSGDEKPEGREDDEEADGGRTGSWIVSSESKRTIARMEITMVRNGYTYKNAVYVYACVCNHGWDCGLI